MGFTPLFGPKHSFARFPVIPVRALANKATHSFLEKQKEVIAYVEKGEMDAKQAQLEIEHFWAGSLRRAVVDGDVDNGSLMAGQSVGLINREQTMADIIEELVAQATSFIAAKDEASSAFPPPPLNAHVG